MKILICLNQDLYCAAILNLISEILKNHQIQIYFSDKVGKKPEIKDLDDLGFYEKTLPLNIIFPLIEKNDQSQFSENFRFLTFKEIFKNQQIPVLDFENINSSEAIYYLKNQQIDLIISVRFGQIFKQEIIDLPKFGIINFHSGILPEFQGIMATFWTMISDHKKFGGSLHFISDSQIDKGDIIDICHLQINPEKSLIWHIFQLYYFGAKMIIKTVDDLSLNKKIKTEKQNHSKAQYFNYPNQKDLENFKTKYQLFNQNDYLEILGNWVDLKRF